MFLLKQNEKVHKMRQLWSSPQLMTAATLGTEGPTSLFFHRRNSHRLSQTVSRLLAPWLSTLVPFNRIL